MDIDLTNSSGSGGGGSGGGSLAFVDIDSNTTAENGSLYLCDVSSDSFTITLPETPSDNDLVQVHNYNGNFSDNSITVDGNGHSINGSSNDYICNINGTTFNFQYSSSNDDWVATILSAVSLKGLLGEYINEVPVLSNQSSDTVNERDYIEIEIDNYDDEASYFVDNELVNRIVYKSSNIFKVYMASVDEDTEVEFRFRATKDGYISSGWSNAITVTINDSPEDEDDSIINDEFSDNEDSSSSVTVTNEDITFTADGGKYTEVVTLQGDDEADWSSYQTSCKIDLVEMFVADSTDKDTLVTGASDIENINKCYILNDDFSDGIEIDIGDVTETDGNIVDSTDPLGDGSLKAKYQLNGNGDDLCGNYNATVENDGVVEEANGKWDSCMKFDATNGKIYNKDFGDFFNNAHSISFWFKTTSTDHDQMLIETYRYSDPDDGFIIRHGGSRGLDVRYYDGSSYLLDNDEIVNDGEWHHLVIMFDGVDTITAYLDKTQLNSATIEAPENAGELRIGYGSYSGGEKYWLDGLVDHVEIYDKNISKDEVDKLYEQIGKLYSADISSNNLDNAPTTAYFIEKNITIKTALTSGDPVDDDFNTENLESWTIDDALDIKNNTYEKVSDYSGDIFQRKVIGDEEANITYLKSLMWKDS